MTETVAGGIVAGRTRLDDEDENNDSNSDTSTIFSSSTHSGLIFYNDKNKSCGDVLLSLLIIICQSILYLYFFAEGLSLFAKTTVNVEIEEDYCGDALGTISFYFNNNMTQLTSSTDYPIDLTCQKQESLNGVSNVLAFVLIPVLLTSFTLADVIDSIKVLRFVNNIVAKISAIYILLLTFMAGFVGMQFAYYGLIQGSMFDAVLNAVGILFVHEMDEFAFRGLNTLDKKGLCKCCDKDTGSQCCYKNQRALIFLIWFAVFFCMLSLISTLDQSD